MLLCKHSLPLHLFLMEKAQVGKQRYFGCSPSHYDKLVLSKKGINADYNTGNNGSIAEGNVLKVDNVTIVKSNYLTTTGLASQAVGKALEGKTLAGWFYTEDVVGITELIGVNTDEWEGEE